MKKLWMWALGAVAVYVLFFSAKTDDRTAARAAAAAAIREAARPKLLGGRVFDQPTRRGDHLQNQGKEA